MSAQVILRTPDRDAARRAMHWFGSQGFAVGEFVGTSFSITAPQSQFRQILGATASKAGAAQLSTERLDPQIRELVETIAQTPPPDFGPGGGYS